MQYSLIYFWLFSFIFIQKVKKFSLADPGQQESGPTGKKAWGNFVLLGFSTVVYFGNVDETIFHNFPPLLSILVGNAINILMNTQIIKICISMKNFWSWQGTLFLTFECSFCDRLVLNGIIEMAPSLVSCSWSDICLNKMHNSSMQLCLSWRLPDKTNSIRL